MSPWLAWTVAGLEEEAFESLDGWMSPWPVGMIIRREVTSLWALGCLMSPLSSLISAVPIRESNVWKFFFTSAKGVHRVWLRCEGLLRVLMGLFDLGRTFLGCERLFVTLPDLRGIVTGIFDKVGLLEVEDPTEHRLLDSMETTGSTGTLSGEFDCLGFL